MPTIPQGMNPLSSLDMSFSFGRKAILTVDSSRMTSKLRHIILLQHLVHAESKEGLTKAVHRVEEVSKTIGMTFGLNKCSSLEVLLSLCVPNKL